MVLNLSDFGPSSCCEIRDLPAPNSDNDQDEIGYISRKKYQYHPRTEEDGGDDHELARKKKVKRSNTDTEADASSSESDHSCFVAFVTASNLHKDALCLPQDLTNSVGLKRKCSEIVVTDERERSWPMDLRFNKSSETFYISRGWRSFCHENGKKAGGIFVFKLVGNEKTPVLSFCSTESFNDGTKGDKNNEDNCMELEGKKKRMRCSPSQNRSVKVTLTHDSLRKCRLHLPMSFVRENGLVTPGIINLLGKDGTKWEANLRRDVDGKMSLGKGWKDFAKANGLNVGESFTLEAISENGSPMLSLFSLESTSIRMQQRECSKDSEKDLISTEPGGDDHELARMKKVKRSNTDTEADASSSEHSCFVALVTASNLHKDALYLPLDLTKSVGLEGKCSEIVVTDERERSWPMDLRFNKSSDTFYIRRGWRSFCHENGKKPGGIFVFKFVSNGKTPVLSFCSTESFNDGTQGDKNNKENCMELESKKKRMRCRYLTSQSLNRFVKVTLTHDSLRNGRLHLPLPFMRENGLVKPGIINLLGKDGTMWEANLRQDVDGKMSLGKGWKDFAKANGLLIGESFALEAILENGTPMLSLFSLESTSIRMQQRECSKDSEKDSKSTEPGGDDHELARTKKVKRSNTDTEADASSSEHSCFVDLVKASNLHKDALVLMLDKFVNVTLTHDSLRKSRLYLPWSFVRENGLLKPGIINLLGKDGTMWEANLLRDANGRMSLGKGWKDFAKANGLNIGESFTLEAISENGTPMLSLFSLESTSINMQQRECSKDSEKDPKSTVPSGGNKTRNATNNKEEKRDSSSAIKSHQFVTLTLTSEDVRDCKLILPSEFMKANGINKLGKITLLGQNSMKWFGYLLSKDGIVAMGCGWKGFCEANGIKTGESFTLECIYEQDTTDHVFKFCSNSLE